MNSVARGEIRIDVDWAPGGFDIVLSMPTGRVRRRGPVPEEAQANLIADHLLHAVVERFGDRVGDISFPSTSRYAISLHPRSPV